MPGPGPFHGYGFDAWAGGPGSGFRGGMARGRTGVFHAGGSGTVGVFGKPFQGGPLKGYRATKTPNTPGDRALEPLGGVEWGKGTAAIGNVLKSRGAVRPRWGTFQGGTLGSAPMMQQQPALGAGDQPTALGAGTQPLALNPAPAKQLGGPTAQRGLGRGAPRPPGPVVMPSGPRPTGPAPTPLALPAQTGSAAPLGPSRSRGRRQAFGQMKFGES
jgi:hypothetical protein